MEACSYRFLCHMRTGGPPAVLDRLASRIQAALEKVARDRELSDDLHTILSTAALVFIRYLQDRAPAALEVAEEFYLSRFQGGPGPSSAPSGPTPPRLQRASPPYRRARPLAADVGIDIDFDPRPPLTLRQAARQAVKILCSDTSKLVGLVWPDVMCEAATILYVAWLASDAPAARSHPAAPFARLFLPRDAGAGDGADSTPAPATAPATAPAPAPAAVGPGELVALLDAAARSGARWSDVSAGAVAVVEGLALSARGAARAARERFLAAAALGGWTALEPAAPAPRRPRDCALGLLFAAFHTGRPSGTPSATPPPATARYEAIASRASNSGGLGLPPLPVGPLPTVRDPSPAIPSACTPRQPEPATLARASPAAGHGQTGRSPRDLRGGEQPMARSLLLQAGRPALLRAAEHCFGLYGDALGARIAREASLL
eukprot:tig00021462_g21598.t1